VIPVSTLFQWEGRGGFGRKRPESAAELGERIACSAAAEGDGDGDGDGGELMISHHSHATASLAPPPSLHWNPSLNCV
jgi:hypothetical protein